MSYSLAFSQAIVTTLFVADKVEQGYFDFVPTKEVAAALGIPRPSAVKILSLLANAGIIETREGARGGVRLAKPAAEVHILHIFDAIETGKQLFRHDFEMGVTGEKPTRAQAAILTLFADAEQAMRAQLAQTTLSELIVVLNAGQGLSGVE
jgi:Rrf2 family protein